MQQTLDMLHFKEQLFPAVCNAKHTHYLMDVNDKVEYSSSWKILNLLNRENYRVPSAVVTVLLDNEHQKLKRKFIKDSFDVVCIQS